MSALGSLNYLAKASAFPCAQPNPLLIIEAGLYAAAPVILSAASFGCTDIIKMRAGVSPWHSRGVRALINGAIPSDQAKIAGKLLKFTIPIEKALFFMFVVDLTVDFFAQWQSQVFKLGACGSPTLTKTGSGPLASYVCSNPNGWARIAYAITYVGGAFGSSTDFIVPAGWFYTAFFSVTVKPFGTPQTVGSCTTRLREIGHGSHSITSDPATPDWFGNPVHAGMHINGTGGKEYQRQFVFEASCDITAIGTGGSAAISISEQPELQYNIVPTSCFKE